MLLKNLKSIYLKRKQKFAQKTNFGLTSKLENWIGPENENMKSVKHLKNETPKCKV